MAEGRNDNRKWAEAADTAAFAEQNAVDLGVVIASLSAVKASSTFFAVKRMLDVLLAAILLVGCLPLFAAIVVAIRIDSGGAAFFRQERVRQGLRTFQIVKFRTMYRQARPYPFAIFDKTTSAYRRPRLSEDPRVTPVGRFLRRFSLDELPQVINILRGEMSFIGPRPLTVPESRLVPPEALVRFAVPSGLSGIAQLRNRSAIVTKSRFDGDVDYVANLSVRQELTIFFATFAKLYDRSI